VLMPVHFPDPCEEMESAIRSGQGFGEEIMTLDEMERGYLEWQVQHSGLGRRELAERLGISERTLFRKLGKLSS
jgi:two-component system response regulator HydG